MLRRLLVVEDDAAHRRLYDRTLSSEYRPRFASSAADARRELARGGLDGVILDVGLPDRSGLEILQEIRENERLRALPVVVITGLATAEDHVTALDAGADDFLEKPVRGEVLLARLRCAFRRAAPSWTPKSDVSVGGLLYKPDSAALSVDGKAVHLHPKELGLMLVFLARPDVLHSGSFLWEQVWGRHSPRWERVLCSTMSNLRRALGTKWGERVECRKGLGYVLRSR